MPVWTALAEEETLAGTASALQVQILQYADLEGRIKEQNPQVQMERISYESRIAAYEMARDDLEETRKHLRREASDREEEGDADGAAHYRSQAEALKQAVEDMDKQIRRASGSSQTLGLSRLEDTMLWTAQNLMGTYNTLKLDRMAAEAEADLRGASMSRRRIRLPSGLPRPERPRKRRRPPRPKRTGRHLFGRRWSGRRQSFFYWRDFQQRIPWKSEGCRYPMHPGWMRWTGRRIGEKHWEIIMSCGSREGEAFREPQAASRQAEGDFPE